MGDAGPGRFLPLAGVRIVDLTSSISGPYCTLVLGALGADVLKVERPGTGDDTRAWGPPFWNDESAAFLAMNANKRSVAVDVKAPGGVEVVRRLVEDADVFVQNLRPGTAGRLGLGFDDLASINPRLVYCSIGAFGATGPLRDQPGYDPLIQAAAGIMSVTGEPDGPPVRAGVSLVDQGTGMWCAIAILAALLVPARAAQHIETSLYEVGLNWLPYQIVGHLATGDVPGRHGSALPIISPYEAFATSDGAILIAAANDALFRRLCDAIGRPELLADRRFHTNADRCRHRDALHQRIAEVIGTADADSCLAALAAAGVPAARVSDVADAVAAPQTAALGILQAMPHRLVADLRLVAPPISVDGERARHRSPPPEVGEHTVAVLTECGFTNAEIDALLAAGAVSGTTDREG